MNMNTIEIIYRRKGIEPWKQRKNLLTREGLKKYEDELHELKGHQKKRSSTED